MGGGGDKGVSQGIMFAYVSQSVPVCLCFCACVPTTLTLLLTMIRTDRLHTLTAANEPTYGSSDHNNDNEQPEQ